LDNSHSEAGFDLVHYRVKLIGILRGSEDDNGNIYNSNNSDTKMNWSIKSISQLVYGVAAALRLGSYVGAR